MDSRVQAATAEAVLAQGCCERTEADRARHGIHADVELRGDRRKRLREEGHEEGREEGHEQGTLEVAGG